MSKAVLISIRPEWCEKIINGQKTIEVRKTRPKIETPFKCYIYCTQNDLLARSRDTRAIFREGSLVHSEDQVQCGHVIGEFVCESINEFVFIKPLKGAVDQNPKISSENGLFDIINIQMMAKLALPELIEYMGWHKSAYAWKISDLIIYDKPKDIRQFAIVDKEAVKMCPHRVRVGQSEAVTKHNGWIKGGYGCEKEHAWEVAYEYCDSCRCKPLNRPPQSWCYVQERYFI